MAAAADKHPCAGRIMDGFHVYGCSRNGSVAEDGTWWCKTHLPSAVKAKSEAKRAGWDAKRDAQDASSVEGEALRERFADLGITTGPPDYARSAPFGSPYDRISISYDEARAILARLTSGSET